MTREEWVEAVLDAVAEIATAQVHEWSNHYTGFSYRRPDPEGRAKLRTLLLEIPPQ